MQDLQTQAGFPIIFDDSSDVIGSVELDDGDAQDEGLLANSNVRAALLSMSGYGKPQYSNTEGKSIRLSSWWLNHCPWFALRTEADRTA